MAYERPEATCGVRVTPSVVSFALLKHTNRSRQLIAGQRMELPRGPLDRTDRRASTIGEDLPAGVVAVETDDGSVHQLSITRDENGVASLSTVQGDDVVFVLPKGRLRLTFFLRSPRQGRLVAAAFQGHLGKPDSQETLPRVAAMALNVLAGLPVFRLISGIETVNVPVSPARYMAVRPVLKASDRVRVQVPVRLWTGDANPVPVGQTSVEVEVDLENANPVSGRLLFHLTPAAGTEDMFRPYRDLVADAALSLVTANLGPEDVSELVYSIVLGELSAGDISRLRDAVRTITGLDVNPRQWVPFTPAA